MEPDKGDRLGVDGEPMTEEELVQVLRREEQRAQHWQASELQSHRADALNYYDRKPVGDEETGQSSVITSEFADTIESIMPSMMRVFASGEDIAEFSPMSREDEQWAKEATLYVPHVLMRMNDGFRILYWMIKDALMYRLGVAIVDVEEKEKRTEKPVEGWTQEQVELGPQLAMQAGATDVEMQVEPDPATGLFSGKIICTHTSKYVCVDNVAPEDILVSPGARDLDDASFAGYRKAVTASDLRKLGLSQDDIREISSDRPQTQEEDQRQDANWVSDRKDSERTMWLVVAYVRVDCDGDGISECYRVVYAHAGGQAGRIIEQVEWEEDEAPITLATPILMPHTIVGRSIFDQTRDFQDVGTALTRGLLDNVYYSNRPRPAINGRVSVSSVIDWVPGMPIIVEGNENPNNALSWTAVPNIIGEAMAALQHFKDERHSRTGVDPHAQGLDPDSMNKTASGIGMVMSASQQRLELIAHTVAATGITRLCRHIYRACKRAATGPTQYFAKGDWQTCDPTKWPDDMHLMVSVGTGTGNKQQEMQNLMLIGQGQAALAQAQGGPVGPLLTLSHYGNTFRKLTEAAGFKNTDQFVASQKEIEMAPPPQPAPDPAMEKVKVDAIAKQAQMQADNELATAKLQSEIALRRMEAEADMQLQREKHALDMQLARDKAALDMQLKREEMAMEAALGKYEIDHAPKPANGAANVREQTVSQ